jgi:hypothetical protein
MGHPDIRIVTHPSVPVTAANSAGFNADHNRIFTRRWIRDVLQVQGSTKLFVNGSFHHNSLVKRRTDSRPEGHCFTLEAFLAKKPFPL